MEILQKKMKVSSFLAVVTCHILLFLLLLFFLFYYYFNFNNLWKTRIVLIFAGAPFPWFHGGVCQFL